MGYESKRKGLVEPSEELSQRVRELVREHGPREAAERLGISRETALSLGCGVRVTRGTMSIVDNAFRSEDAEEATV